MMAILKSVSVWLELRTVLDYLIIRLLDSGFHGVW